MVVLVDEIHALQGPRVEADVAHGQGRGGGAVVQTAAGVRQTEKLGVVCAGH